MDIIQSSNRVINRFPTLNNITPFTRVDGWSFLEVLEGLRYYIINTLVTDIDDRNALITEQMNEWFDQYTIDNAEILADIEATKVGWQAFFDQFMADVVAQLEALNDQAVTNLVNNKLSLIRAALDKLIFRETRNIMEFIPVAQHAGILAGTSTWDSATIVNYAIREMGGGQINIPKGAQLSVGSPIDIIRGTLLKGGGTFDNATGVGSKIKLLPGAHSSMLRTPLAAGGVATHFIGLENLIFDGNKEYQTVQSTGVDFRGVYVGSHIRNVSFTKTFGTALRLGQGVDVNLSHVWVYDNDTTGYAMTINEGLVNGADGIIQMDNIYVEHNGVGQKRVGFPKDVSTNRGKGLLINAPVQLTLDTFHSEGVSTPLTISGNGQLINIGSVTTANIGNPETPSAVVEFKDTSSYVVNIAATKRFAATPNTKTITLTGATSNEFVEVDDDFVGAWQYYRSGYAKTFLPNRTRANNRFRVQKNGGFTGHGIEIMDGEVGLSVEGTTDSEYFRVYSNKSGVKTELLSFRSKVNVHETIASVPLRLTEPAVENITANGSVFLKGAELQFKQNGFPRSVPVIRQVSNVAPTANANQIGEIYIDTLNLRGYLAVAVGTGANDWKQITI